MNKQLIINIALGVIIGEAVLFASWLFYKDYTGLKQAVITHEQTIQQLPTNIVEYLNKNYQPINK